MKNARDEPYWGEGEKSLQCDPGSDFTTRKERERRAKVIKGMEKKKKKNAGDAKMVEYSWE